jgi:integral membrane protein
MNLLNTKIGRLRVLGFFEGISLILLFFVAVPLKYIMGDPAMVKIVGPIHGGLFLFFLYYSISVSMDLKWAFRTITWKLVVASIVPFGTFYIDKAVLSKMKQE